MYSDEKSVTITEARSSKWKLQKSLVRTLPDMDSFMHHHDAGKLLLEEGVKWACWIQSSMKGAKTFVDKKCNSFLIFFINF